MRNQRHFIILPAKFYLVLATWQSSKVPDRNLKDYFIQDQIIEVHKQTFVASELSMNSKNLSNKTEGE